MKVVDYEVRTFAANKHYENKANSIYSNRLNKHFKTMLPFNAHCFITKCYTTKLGSPGKNGTYRKSFQRCLIVNFIHS